MLRPDVANREYEKGRGEALPSYASDILLAKWAGISPTEVEDLPLELYNQLQTVMEAEGLAHKQASRKK